MSMTLLLTIAVSFVLTLVLGKYVIAELRRIKAGQEIRDEGPKWHAGKAGTPTMGGIMFIIGTGITVFVLGWKHMLTGELIHLYVYVFALILAVSALWMIIARFVSAEMRV